MGHNYFGKSVAHVLRRFLNNSDPISLKFCTGHFQVKSCNKSTINVIRIIYLIFYNIYFGVFTVAGIHRFPIYLRVIDMLGRQLRT